MYTYVIIRVSTLNNMCVCVYIEKQVVEGGGGGGAGGMKKRGGVGGGGVGGVRGYDKTVADAGAIGGCAESLMAGT